jgi:hypothetical protein
MGDIIRVYNKVLIEGTITRFEARQTSKGGRWGFGSISAGIVFKYKAEREAAQYKNDFIPFVTFSTTVIDVLENWGNTHPSYVNQRGDEVKIPIWIMGQTEVKEANGQYPASDQLKVWAAGEYLQVLDAMKAKYEEDNKNGNAPASQAAYVPPQTYAGNPGARTQANQARQQYQSAPPPPSAGRPPYTPPAPTYAPPPPAQAYGGEADPDYDPFSEE